MCKERAETREVLARKEELVLFCQIIQNVAVAPNKDVCDRRTGLENDRMYRYRKLFKSTDDNECV